jgi:SGNH domain (fused to AT3 domains)
MRPNLLLDARLRAVGEVAGAHIIDPIDYLCNSVCPTITPDGWPVYRDEGHLEAEYVRSHVYFLDSLLRLSGKQNGTIDTKTWDNTPVKSSASN